MYKSFSNKMNHKIFWGLVLLVLLGLVFYKKKNPSALSMAPFIFDCNSDSKFSKEKEDECNQCFSSYADYSDEYYPYYSEQTGCRDAYSSTVPSSGLIATNKGQCAKPKCTKYNMTPGVVCKDNNRACKENSECCSGSCISEKCGY